MTSHHKLRSIFDKEYSAIEDDLVRIQELVDAALEKGLLSLQNLDIELAEEIIQGDGKINELRFKIEEACLRLIATQQPAATDLRAVMAAMSIVIDIERMGDHAAGIAKTVILAGDEQLLKTLDDIPRMFELARRMLRDVLDAYIRKDASRAREVAVMDDTMDDLYKAVFNELVEIMAQKPESAERATYLLWTAHNLERIADRVTNISERVIFVTTGDLKELNT